VKKKRIGDQKVLVSTTTSRKRRNRRVHTAKQTLCCNLKFEECGGQN
jgi:hypothetical protein